MRFRRLFTCLVILLTTSSIAAYPLAEVPIFTVRSHSSSKKNPILQKLKRDEPIHSYDEVVNLLKEIENGALEKHCSEDDLFRVNQFLVKLAQEGVISNDILEKYRLACDIQELFEESPIYEYALSDGEECFIVPQFYPDDAQFVLCKSSLSKKWKKVRKFVKKHKKAIIIGAAVVVATAVVIYTCGAATPAAVAGVNETIKSQKEDKKTESEDATASNNDSSNDPINSESFGPKIIEFLESNTMRAEAGLLIKERMAESGVLQTLVHSSTNEEPHFVEVVREVTSNITHEIYDEIVKFIPPPLDLPNLAYPPKEGSIISRQEFRDEFVAAGHQIIDQVFFTDQADLYRPENQSINKPLIGMIPLPSGIAGLFGDFKTLLEAGKAADRAGFTVAGRALMKHGNRAGSVFPKPSGNPAAMNEHGQKILETILSHPERQMIQKQVKVLGEVVDIHAPGVGGVRYTPQGEMVGFLEP